MPETFTRREMYRFEESWTPERGPKSAAVQEHFNLPLSAYYAEMAQSANEPWAVDEFPSLTVWLKRLDDERRSRMIYPTEADSFLN